MRFAARLLVAVLCVVAMVPVVKGAAHSANSGAYRVASFNRPRQERATQARMEYLGLEMSRRIPVGTRAYFDEPDALWLFRLEELATLYGIVLAAREADADVVVRKRDDPAAPHGVRLEITPAATR